MDHQHLQRTINEKVVRHIPERAWDSTVAIVMADNGAVHQFGTGILFSIAADSFAVTAGHVVKEAVIRGKTLGLSSATGSFAAVPGEWLVSSEGQYGTDKDPFDVAIQKLPRDTIEKLRGKTFLRFDDIDFTAQSPTSVYTLFGFPALWSDPSTSDSIPLQLKPLQYTTFAYDRETDSFAEYQERFHLLLEAQLEGSSVEDGSAARFKDRKGSDAPFPRRLGGISGCSVWRIGDLNLPIEAWGQKRPRVVAVQTSVYHGKGAIKATRWIAVSTILHQGFPEHRAAIELWRPP